MRKEGELCGLDEKEKQHGKCEDSLICVYAGGAGSGKCQKKENQIRTLSSKLVKISIVIPLMRIKITLTESKI